MAYLVFFYQENDPQGGIADYIGSFETKDQALEFSHQYLLEVYSTFLWENELVDMTPEEANNLTNDEIITLYYKYLEDLDENERYRHIFNLQIANIKDNIEYFYIDQYDNIIDAIENKYLWILSTSNNLK